MSNWSAYYKKHSSRPPRPLLVKALNFVKNKESALDIGAGTLIESKFLLDSDFKKVVAVDHSSEIKNFAEHLQDPRLEIKINPFQDLILLPNSFDLISAQYSLPFYGSKGFSDFIYKLSSSLRKDGVFVGQFFGIRDGWNTPKNNLAFQTKEEALLLLKDFKIEEFKEEERDGTTASGEAKHWHVFHFIAIK